MPMCSASSPPARTWPQSELQQPCLGAAEVAVPAFVRLERVHEEARPQARRHLTECLMRVFTVCAFQFTKGRLTSSAR